MKSGRKRFSRALAMDARAFCSRPRANCSRMRTYSARVSARWRWPSLRRQQAGDHADRPTGVRHIDGRAGEGRLDLHRGVGAAGGGAADQQRLVAHAATLHLAGHKHHLVERGRDQPRQPDDVAVLVARSVQDAVGGHHHAEVDHLVVVALEHDADDRLADVVARRPFDRRHQHLAGVGARGRRPASASMKGIRWATACFITPGGLYHLGQEHLARAEQVADHVHPVHQGAFDDVQRARDRQPRLLRVRHHELRHAVHQGVLEPLGDGGFAPAQVHHPLRALVALVLWGQIDQPLGGVRDAGSGLRPRPPRASSASIWS